MVFLIIVVRDRLVVRLGLAVDRDMMDGREGLMGLGVEGDDGMQGLRVEGLRVVDGLRRRRGRHVLGRGRDVDRLGDHPYKTFAIGWRGESGTPKAANCASSLTGWEKFVQILHIFRAYTIDLLTKFSQKLEKIR